MRISDWSSDVCSSDLAVRAGGAAAAVRAQLLHEIARCAVRGEEVAQRGAAAGDGVFEDPPYRVGEQAVALARDLAGGAQRRDAGGKQRLGGVDVEIGRAHV